MYHLTAKQIDYIFNDIGARGVEMKSLQLNLLDHICCIIEQNLEETGDFESFYQKTIKTFYKDALWELEEETIFLLTFKNYYHMKKIMIVSGAFAAFAMTFGIFFKFMHWPGASILLVLGIITSSLIFLPLLFTIKAKEQESTKEKLILGLGTLSGILMSLSILFKVMHWPLANNLGIISLIILGLVFLPIYFFTGIRHPEKKVNTMTTSILVIMVCGLWLTLMRTPSASRIINIRDTSIFVTNEQIVKNEKKLLEKSRQKDILLSSNTLLSQNITNTCQELKNYIIETETGQKVIDEDFESKSVLLIEQNNINPFTDPAAKAKVNELLGMIDKYNSLLKEQNVSGLKKIPTRNSFVEYLRTGNTIALSLMSLLNELTQVQMFVLQNERELLAMK